MLGTLVSLLLLVACDRANEVRDTGKNSGLTNEELLAKAVADMKELKSYHFELNGTLPDMSVGKSGIYIVGDMQTDERGSKITASSEASTSNSSPTSSTIVVPTESSVNVILVNGHWNESYDKGKTWDVVHIDSPAYLFIGTFGLPWDTRFSSGYPTTGERMIQSLTFKDGTPRVESIDGITTRHMVVEPIGTPSQESIGSPSVLVMEGAKALNIWVSTDITPTIRQMTVEGSRVDNLSANPSPEPESPLVNAEESKPNVVKPYSLTWKWSQFNEDFGVVNPPSPESINTPSP